jgi:S1-C subfamily serine protease
MKFRQMCKIAVLLTLLNIQKSESFQVCRSPVLFAAFKREVCFSGCFAKTSKSEERSEESRRRKGIWPWRKSEKTTSSTNSTLPTIAETYNSIDNVTSPATITPSIVEVLFSNRTIQETNESMVYLYDRDDSNNDFSTLRGNNDTTIIQGLEAPMIPINEPIKKAMEEIVNQTSQLKKASKQGRSLPFFLRKSKVAKTVSVSPLPKDASTLAVPVFPDIHRQVNRSIDNTSKDRRERQGGIFSLIRRFAITSLSAAVLMKAFMLYPVVDDFLHCWIQESTTGLRRLQQQYERPQIEDTLIDFPSVSRPPAVSTKSSHSSRPTSSLSYVKEAVKKVGPSVLRIDTETHMNENMVTPHPSAWIQQGQGSGLIFSSDGLVLTNAHVVEDATKVLVTLTDGRTLRAEVKGSDAIVDVAVLKIIPGEQNDDFLKNLPVAEWGDSDELEVGQFVIAVGTPGGLDNTVTMGIVSGLGRSATVVGISHMKVDYIQTDAAINLGNSGGPLVDVETGKVVGINACIRTNMEGTSFAIPINRIREILMDLSEGRHVSHGYLGVSFSTSPRDNLRHSNGNSDSAPHVSIRGPAIECVFENTPAAMGGLKQGDIVTEIGGKKISSSDEARLVIDAAPVGKDLTVLVWRQEYGLVTLTLRPVDLATRLKEGMHEREQHHSRGQMQTVRESTSSRSALQKII